MSQQFQFHAASTCGGPCSEGCVEVAINVPGTVALRDSKTGITAQFDHREWSGFLAGVKAGEFDV